MPTKRLRGCLGVAALALVLSACVGGADAVDQEAGGEFRFVAGDGTNTLIEPAERRAAPRFGGELLGGGEFDPATLEGKVVVLNFWGSWCAPCRVETPEFQEVHERTKDHGVAFVGVDVKDSEQLAQAFVDAEQVTYPSIFDPKGMVALRFRDYPPNAIPSTIVLDRQYRVAAVFLKPMLASDLEPVVTRIADEG